MMAYSGFAHTAPEAWIYNDSSSPVTANPCTLACWYKWNGTSSDKEMMSLNASASVYNRNSIQLGMNTSNKLVARQSDGSGRAASATTTALTSGQWQSCVGVYSSITSRTAYLDGVAATTDTVSRSPSGINRTRIGAAHGSEAGHNASESAPGDIAECAIWSAALSSDEVVSLAKGVSARLIRPQSLVFYAPMIRGLIDVRGGLALSIEGSLTVSDHPRIFY